MDELAARPRQNYPWPMRSVFFGTPAIAVPALEALHATSTLVGVVCQPDRPKGRGLKLQAPEVKHAAQRLGVPVFQPQKVRTGELSQWLHEQRPDVALVLAYGRILPAGVLGAPRHGCLNLHASLLPAYRGAAPINWALINGETETGMSLMQMNEGLDEGPVFQRRTLALDARIDAGTLSEQMAALAADMVRQDLPRALDGSLSAQPQDATRATFAPPLSSEHLAIDWSWPAARVVNRVRGLSPRPGARALLHGRMLKLLEAEVTEGQGMGEPGTILHADKAGILVQAGSGCFKLLRAQPEGKKALSASELVNGRFLAAGQRLEAWAGAVPA